MRAGRGGRVVVVWWSMWWYGREIDACGKLAIMSPYTTRTFPFAIVVVEVVVVVVVVVVVMVSSL